MLRRIFTDVFLQVSELRWKTSTTWRQSHVGRMTCRPSQRASAAAQVYSTP